MSRLAIDVHSRSPPPRRAALTHACSKPPMHTRSQACAASTAASVGATTAADFSSIVIRVSGSASSTSARQRDRLPSAHPHLRQLGGGVRGQAARAVGGAVQRDVVVHDGDAVRARVHVQLEVAEALRGGPA